MRVKTSWKIALLLPFLALCFSDCVKPEKEILTFVGPQIIEVDAEQAVPYIMSIAANFLWSVERTATWLIVTPDRAFGDKNIEIKVTPNTSLEPRQASFFICGEVVRQEFKVIQKGETPTLTLGESSRAISAAGGEVDVVLTTNLEVEITSDASWVSRIATKTVTAATYYFKVEQNTNMEARTAKVLFKQKGGGLQQTLIIVQQGEAPGISLSRTSMSLDATGGNQAIVVTANVPWTATPSKSWITITPDTKLMTPTVCYFNVAANTRVEPREAEILFTKAGSTTELAQSLLISQVGAAPMMSFTPSDHANLPAAASTKKLVIAVTANFNWMVDFTRTAAWVTDVSFDGTQCTFNVKANEDVSARSTSLVFKQIGVPESSAYTKEFTIGQVAAASQLVVTRQDLIQPVAAAGGLTHLTVTANLPWSYEKDVHWISQFQTKALETDLLIFEVAKNEGSVSRTATLTFKTSMDQVVRTITQNAGDPVLKLSATEIDFPATGGVKEFTVTSNVEWEITKSQTWIQLPTAPAVKKDGALRDSVIKVTTLENQTLSAREGVITVTQKGGTLKREMIVKQAGVAPSFEGKLSKSVLKATGESFNIEVKSNFSVKLSSNQSWVSFVDSVDIAGGRRYNFTAAATPVGSAREATVTFKRVDGLGVFEQGFKVVQNGAAVSVADSTVLANMYNTLGGILWPKQWDIRNKPVSQWAGVTLSKDPIPGEPGVLRVTGLDLSGSLLIGNIEGNALIKNRIESLIYLKKLNLSNNPGLYGSLPAAWGSLTYLEELDLSYCQFENSGEVNIPVAWGKKSSGGSNLPILKVLKLNNNLLGGDYDGVKNLVPKEIQEHPMWLEWDPNRNILPQRNAKFLILTPPSE